VLESRGVVPLHLTEETVAHLLSPHRVADAERWASLPEDVNRDLRPTTYRLALDRFLSELGDPGAPALWVLAALLALAALFVYRPRTRPVELAVFSSGAAGLSSQLVLMLGYQIAAGALYRELGLFLAGFMLGAVFGALWGGKLGSRRSILWFDLGVVALALGLSQALAPLVTAGGWALPLILLATALAGFLPGAQFAAAAVGRTDAGELWAADLLGAAVAALVTFTMLVPAMGVSGTFLAIALFK